jgi:MerR family transcriptional regulator, mercuric resistance operon regulatory protein
MAIERGTGPDTGPLSVGQLAARAGVRADTIRYYERAGLLPEPSRTDGDHRRYGPADLDRMLFIRGARRLGLRLAEIRELVMVRDTGACPCGPAEVLLREHVVEIDREIARLSALRAELSSMLSGLSGTSGRCLDPVPGTWRAVDRQDAEPDPRGGDLNVLMLR